MGPFETMLGALHPFKVGRLLSPPTPLGTYTFAPENDFFDVSPKVLTKCRFGSGFRVSISYSEVSYSSGGHNLVCLQKAQGKTLP